LFLGEHRGSKVTQKIKKGEGTMATGEELLKDPEIAGN
jgi:hypothetical protein